MSGLLAKVVTDGTTQLVTTVPDVEFAVVSITVINATAQEAELAIYATTGPTPSLVDTLEHSVFIPANGGRYVMSCSTMSPGEKIFVKSSPGLVVRIEAVDEE